jgi:hypothetical protein
MKNSINKIAFVALIALALGFVACSNPAGGSPRNIAEPKLVIDFGTTSPFATATPSPSMIIVCIGSDQYTFEEGSPNFITTAIPGSPVNYKVEIDVPSKYSGLLQVRLVLPDSRPLPDVNGDSFKDVVFGEPQVPVRWEL